MIELLMPVAQGGGQDRGDNIGLRIELLVPVDEPTFPPNDLSRIVCAGCGGVESGIETACGGNGRFATIPPSLEGTGGVTTLSEIEFTVSVRSSTACIGSSKGRKGFGGGGGGAL